MDFLSRNGQLIGICHAMPKTESKDLIRAWWVAVGYGLYHISLFSVWNHCMDSELRRWNMRPQNKGKRKDSKCKETICSKKRDMHWNSHDCGGKWTCLKRISALFGPLLKSLKGKLLWTLCRRWDAIKRYWGCIGASPLFDLFASPMIELCDIFSLDNHSIGAVFVRFLGLRYFAGHVWLSAWREKHTHDWCGLNRAKFVIRY